MTLRDDNFVDDDFQSMTASRSVIRNGHHTKCVIHAVVIGFAVIQLRWSSALRSSLRVITRRVSSAPPSSALRSSLRVITRSVYICKVTYIIGEIGQNHNGDMGLAVELIHAAKENGAEWVPESHNPTVSLVVE